jgi:flagellar hook-associated protein 3 FlgL
MTIINRSMFPLSNGINNIMSMKQRYDKLQTQLATGLKAASLGEMGSDRYFDLALRQRISAIDSYQTNIKTVNLRLNVLDQTVSRLDTIEADARAATMSGSGGQASLNFQTTPTLAASRFDEVMTLMNVDIAGRYLFGGAHTDVKPVEDAFYALNGRGGQAGFRQIAGERRLADLGATHLGRLTASTTTNTTTLAEDGVHPFGMKLSTISTTSANITVTAPTGSPQSLTVQFGATLPTEGEMVTISLTLPDGTTEAVRLIAVTSPGEPGSFVVGPDADTTAANFNAALTTQLQTLAEGTMTTASAYAAAENFFFGQGGQPMRVDGPPYDTATALVAGTDTDTVFWYKGEDTADPRHTVTARIGERTTVAYGVQANEGGLVNLVRSLATMAVQSFTVADPTSADRYSAMVIRNTERLAETGDSNGSIASIAVELGLAQSTAGAVNARHTEHKAQLSNMLQDIEVAPTEEVAMSILALKTRLEASYQATALLSQLSLVNYLR